MAVERKSRGDKKMRRYLMTASKTIEAGDLVMIVAAGTAETAAAAASNKGVVGVASAKAVSGASGATYVDVQEGEFLVDATSIAQTAVGSLMYASSGSTVDETQGSNQPIAGMLTEYVSATSGWIAVGPEFLT